MKDKDRIKTSYWPNGKRWCEIPYVNGNVHGLAIGWYSNGNKRWETTCKNNIQHGSNIEFNY